LRKLRRHPALRTQIINQLETRWSPEQIAGRLLSDGLSRIRVCKETIYRFIYSKEEYELGLYQYLAEARRKRRPMHSRKPRDGAFPASQRISQRPDFMIDRGLGIGRETFSSSNAHSAMPMSPRLWSARAATPFLSRTPAGTRGQLWTRSSEPFRLCRRSRVRASHLVGVPNLPGSGLWKTGLVRGAGFAIKVRRGKKGQSRTQTSAFDATCPAPQISRPCRNATLSSSRATSMISRANASDT
jgi:hypothetical protein